MNIRQITLLTIFIFISLSSGAESLPDDIYFKTMEQGFSYEYLYALKDGKIWIKPHEKNTGVKGSWELFNKTGIPDGEKALSFAKNDRITQFSTEGTMITALSNKGRVYLWQPTYKEKTVWYDVTGAPIEEALYMPKNKLWSFAFSTMRAPWKRATPMHEKDIVTYWEDIDVNKTEFGFTATIYSVDPDGQKIRYTDTGLPTSWNKAFTSPERGRFIIENMSTSASTVFVINRTGKMYTKMIDYELEGGCPALKYVYTRGRRTNGDTIAPLITSVRTLPLPDWREQEPVEEILAAQTNSASHAAVTKKITILLTGKGNAARELRIQGRDADGSYGYWKKNIFEKKWQFVITGQRFSDGDIITGYLQKAPEGNKLDTDYKGVLRKIGEPDLSVELLGFYYYSTPAVLRVHINKKQFDMAFHTVDLWNPIAQKKDFPELVGHPSGEPKLLQGTLVIPEEILASSDPDIKKTLDRYFRQYNLKPLAFKVSADNRKVIITNKIIQRKLNENMDYEFRGRIKIELTRTGETSAHHTDMFYTSLAQLPDLEIPENWPSFSKNDITAINTLIDRNTKALAEMKSLNSKFRKENFKAGVASAVGLTSYFIFDGIVNIIGLPSWNLLISDPGRAEAIAQIGGVSYTGSSSLSEYALMNLKKALDDPEDYKMAVIIFEQRISTLIKLRKTLAAPQISSASEKNDQ